MNERNKLWRHLEPGTPEWIADRVRQEQNRSDALAGYATSEEDERFYSRKVHSTWNGMTLAFSYSKIPTRLDGQLLKPDAEEVRV